jgi:hypothetical protein
MLMVGALSRQFDFFSRLRILMTASLLSLLAACGGSGGGGSGNINAASSSTLSLQGSILVAAGALVDSDINNASQNNVSNNTPSTAQTIPSFTELGGYVNLAGTGPAGPLFNSGDTLDYFRIYLYEGQSIVLDIYDADNADLDLYLLNATGTIILDFPTSTGFTEQLNAPFEGYFQILVEAVSGASNYTLRTEQTVNLGSTAVRLSDAFVPEELIVRFRQPYLYQQQLYQSDSTLNRYNLQSTAGESTRAMRLSLNARSHLEGTDFHSRSNVATQINRGQLGFLNEIQAAKYRTLLALKALQEDRDVLYAQANIQIQSAAVPNDPRYDEQWSLPLIELPAAWDISTGSSEVIVAVVDSGIISSHPDIAANLIAGYDFIADADNAQDGNGLDAYRDTLSEVRQRNILVVAAAGNGNDDSNRFVPANCNDVFAVSAVDYNRQLAPYSNSGNVIDLAAPGGRDDVDQDANGIIDGVLSPSGSKSGSNVNPVYEYRYGTSMAAPHVSGILALMLAVNPALSVDNIEQMLLSGLLTDDLGIGGRDNQFGHGLINARKALNAAVDSLSGSSGLGAYMTSSINGFEFRPSLSQTDFETRIVDDASVSINSVSKSAAWLTVTQPGTAGGVGQWRLNVNRNGLAAGLYQDTVSIVTSSNTLNLDILLQVNDPAQIYEVGPLQIVLQNTVSNSSSRLNINEVNGSYRFNFNNLASGTYRLVVNSDLNGDGLADAGEALVESDSFELGSNLVLTPLSLTWDSALISSPAN